MRKTRTLAWTLSSKRSQGKLLEILARRCYASEQEITEAQEQIRGVVLSLGRAGEIQVKTD